MILSYIDSAEALCDNNGEFGHRKITNKGENKVIYLGDLSIGEKAKIIGYSACNLLCRRKLLVMGLTPGTILKVIGIAPLGDPVQILLRGLTICLRKNEARILKLEKISA
jgi:ferrous iron transport protein A